MAIQFSIAVRNARLEAIETAIGGTAHLVLYSGAPPVNCATAASGTKLAEWTLATDWSPVASGGVKSLNLPASIVGLAAGNLGYFRLTASDGTTTGEQGTITATGGGGDMTVDNISVTVGQTINLTGWTWTEAGA
jgi:hypothetical protein